MNPVIDTSFAALVTKSIVDELKNRDWIKSGGFMTLVASFLINFVVLLVLSLIQYAEDGLELNLQIIKTASATILAALYNDFRKSAVGK